MSACDEIFTFPENDGLARAVGARLGALVCPIDIHRFPDGESLVHVESASPGRALIVRSLDHPNEKLFELLLAADALRRQGVKEIGLIAPYLGYMRQDRVFHPGEPISQQVMARLLGSAFDSILTVEAHLHRIQHLSQIFSCPAESITAADPIARWLRERHDPGVVVGPDAESEPWIRAVAAKADCAWVVARKTRHADRSVQIDLPRLPDGAHDLWIIDDIASSGATLEALVRILKKRGARSVRAIVVHALLDPGTPERLAQAGLDQLLSTDSIVHPSNAITLAPLLADTLAARARLAEVS